MSHSECSQNRSRPLCMFGITVRKQAPDIFASSVTNLCDRGLWAVHIFEILGCGVECSEGCEICREVKGSGKPQYSLYFMLDSLQSMLRRGLGTAGGSVQKNQSCSVPEGLTPSTVSSQCVRSGKLPGDGHGSGS